MTGGGASRRRGTCLGRAWLRVYLNLGGAITPLPSRLSQCFLVLQDADQRQHLCIPRTKPDHHLDRQCLLKRMKQVCPGEGWRHGLRGGRSTELKINVLSDMLLKCDSWPRVSLFNRLGSQLRPSQVGILMPPKAARTVSGRLPPSCEAPPLFSALLPSLPSCSRETLAKVTMKDEGQSPFYSRCSKIHKLKLVHSNGNHVKYVYLSPQRYGSPDAWLLNTDKMGVESSLAGEIISFHLHVNSTGKAEWVCAMGQILSIESQCSPLRPLFIQGYSTLFCVF